METFSMTRFTRFNSPSRSANLPAVRNQSRRAGTILGKAGGPGASNALTNFVLVATSSQ